MKLRFAAAGLACALAACAGKKSSTTATEEAPPPCREMAVHVAEVIRADLGDALAEEHWPKVTAVLDERCTMDGWETATVACMQAAVRGPDFDVCAEQLPDDQEAAVKDQFEQTIKPLMKEGAMQKQAEDKMEGGGSPPTGSAPPSDPCGGGE